MDNKEELTVEFDGELLNQLKALLVRKRIRLEDLMMGFIHWCVDNPELAQAYLLKWQAEQREDRKGNQTMEDLSMKNIVFARRLDSGRIEYGLSGIDGAFSAFCASLLEEHSDPIQAACLFEQGRLDPLRGTRYESLGRPAQNIADGEPTFLGDSEREIFLKLNQVDELYFYDLDNTWYYVTPGPFHVKIPLDLMAAHLRARAEINCPKEDFLWDVDLRLIEEITDRYDIDEGFRAYLYQRGYDREKFLKIMDDVSRLETPNETHVEQLRNKHRDIFEFFDDWAVVLPHEDDLFIHRILLREWEDNHEETIGWADWEDNEG